MIKEEENYPEISDLVVLPHLVLMCTFSSAAERVKFVESRTRYVYSLNEQSETFDYIIRVYLNDLLKIYEPEKVLSVYKTLPLTMQTNNAVYYDYGYANYLMANKSATVLERDVYISRAVNIFKQLIKRDYDIGSFMNSWLNAVESL